MQKPPLEQHQLLAISKLLMIRLYLLLLRYHQLLAEWFVLYFDNGPYLGYVLDQPYMELGVFAHLQYFDNGP